MSTYVYIYYVYMDIYGYSIKFYKSIIWKSLNKS